MVHSVFPIFHFFSFWMWIIFKVYWIYYSVASVLYFEFLALRYIESYRKRLNQSVLKEISPEYSLEGLMLKLQYFGHLMPRTDSLEKTLMLGKSEGRRRRGRERMRWFGWHHRLDGHEFEQAPGVGGALGSLVCCSPWGHKESDTT